MLVQEKKKNLQFPLQFQMQKINSKSHLHRMRQKIKHKLKKTNTPQIRQFVAARNPSLFQRRERPMKKARHVHKYLMIRKLIDKEVWAPACSEKKKENTKHHTDVSQFAVLSHRQQNVPPCEVQIQHRRPFRPVRADEVGAARGAEGDIVRLILIRQAFVVPQSHLAVVSRGSEHRVLAAKGQCVDWFGVVVQLEHLLGHGNVPDVQAAVPTARGEVLATAGEAERLGDVLVASEVAHAGAGGDVPYADSAVGGRRGYVVGVGVECDTVHVVVVSDE